eukprot:479631-Alexandrium_andersonii.AAC.1
MTAPPGYREPRNGFSPAPEFRVASLSVWSPGFRVPSCAHDRMSPELPVALLASPDLRGTLTAP